jgi:hypothetical protein
MPHKEAFMNRRAGLTRRHFLGAACAGDFSGDGRYYGLNMIPVTLEIEG